MASYFVRRGDAEFAGELGFLCVFGFCIKVLEASGRKVFAFYFLQFPQMLLLQPAGRIFTRRTARNGGGHQIFKKRLRFQLTSAM